MNDIEKKLWRKVYFYLPLLRFIPFVRLVAVCNNLSFGKVKAESDIDVFIIAKKGRLFFVRTLITLLFQILGVRRHGKKTSQRFCLSFFIDTSVLDLSNIAIEDDVYLALWVNSVIPVVDFGVYQSFLDSNPWVKAYVDDLVVQPPVIFKNKPLFTRLFEWIFSRFIGDFLEKTLKMWQIPRSRKKAGTASSKASLIISEHMLKFHNIDRRAEYRDAFRVKYGSELATKALFRDL